MKKYFNWKFINSPPGHRLLLIVVIAGLVLWYVFRKVPEDNSKDALIQQKELESRMKDSAIAIRDEYINIVKQSNASLRKAVDEKDQKIIRIYERTENRINAFDTASITDMQRFFKDRYPTP